RRGRFAAKNIQPTVNLEGVGSNDFGAKPLRYFERQISLVTTPWTRHHHIFRIRHKTKTRALQESAGEVGPSITPNQAARSISGVFAPLTTNLRPRNSLS